MFGKTSTPSTRRIRSVHVVAAGALVVAMSGSATAAMVITGKQIKDGSVTGKDIKNGSLLVQDLKKSEVAKLRGSTGSTGVTGATGATGATGGTGAAGASAFAPPPSGTVIQGSGILDVEVDTGGMAMMSYAPLPFTTKTPLDVSAPPAQRNLYFGADNSASLSPSAVNATVCPGTAEAPNPTAGYMCVYVRYVRNILPASGTLFPGDTGFPNSNGFYVTVSSDAGLEMIVRYVWAYKAP